MHTFICSSLPRGALKKCLETQHAHFYLFVPSPRCIKKMSGNTTCTLLFVPERIRKHKTHTERDGLTKISPFCFVWKHGRASKKWHHLVKLHKTCEVPETNKNSCATWLGKRTTHPTMFQPIGRDATSQVETWTYKFDLELERPSLNWHLHILV